MSYSRSALDLAELTRTTTVNLTDLLLVETPSASLSIQYQDLVRNAATSLYSFSIDSNGHLNVLVTQTGDYDMTQYKEWYIGGAGTTFSLTVSSLVVTI